MIGKRASDSSFGESSHGLTSCTNGDEVQHSDERPDNMSDTFLAERRRAMENEQQQLWCPRLPRHC